MQIRQKDIYSIMRTDGHVQDLVYLGAERRGRERKGRVESRERRGRENGERNEGEKSREKVGFVFPNS